MDAQELHDLELRNVKVTKGSRKRVEDLLSASVSSSLAGSQLTTLDPIAAAAKELGVAPEELAKAAEEMGF